MRMIIAEKVFNRRLWRDSKRPRARAFHRDSGGSSASSSGHWQDAGKRMVRPQRAAPRPPPTEPALQIMPPVITSNRGLQANVHELIQLPNISVKVRLLGTRA